MKTNPARVRIHRSGHIALMLSFAVVSLGIMTFVVVWAANHKADSRATLQIKAPAKSGGSMAIEVPAKKSTLPNTKTSSISKPAKKAEPLASAEKPVVVQETKPVPAAAPLPEGTSVPVPVTTPEPAPTPKPVAVAPVEVEKPAAVVAAPAPVTPEAQPTTSAPAAPAAPAAENATTGKPYIAAAGRSPIPQPGEEGIKPIEPKKIEEGSQPKRRPPGVTAKEAAAIDPTPTTLVPWDKAGENVGKTITVEGTIVAAHNTGAVCFLNFDKNYQDKFYVVIADASLLSSWAQPPETFFMNKKIRVTGKVSLYQQKRPEMRVLRPDQIVVVEP